MKQVGKIILDLCGGTGSWSRPYKEAGYDVRLVTLPDSDVRLFVPPDQVYGVLAAPPCTEFSFAKHFHGKGKYSHNFLNGLSIADACLRIIEVCSPKFWALENPVGYLRKWYGEPRFIFEPYFYGDKYQKRTALWGKFNAPLPETVEEKEKYVKFSMLKSKEIHPELYGKYDRQARRAVTPSGFAKAFFEVNK